MLESHRTGITQRRMQPSMVVEGNPVHHLILGLTPRAEAHAVEAFDLQRAEQFSVTALSQQSPLRLIELSILNSRSSLR